jgi:hypothetical protein
MVRRLILETKKNDVAVRDKIATKYLKYLWSFHVEDSLQASLSCPLESHTLVTVVLMTPRDALR